MATQKIVITESPIALQDLPGVRATDIFYIQVDGLSGCKIGQYISAPAVTDAGVRLAPYSPGSDDSLSIRPNSDLEKDWVWVAPNEPETSLIVINQSPN